MPKRGKQYREAVAKFDKTALYEAPEALKLAVEASHAKFDETVEVHIRLGVDGRHADQQVRGAIVLPHGTGKTKKVLVFAKGPKAQEAEEAGADYVGAEELAQKIQTENWFDFDVVVATPDMMGVVGRLGKILGPKGLMPNPKSGTVTMDVTKALQEIKAGKVEYRLDKTNIIHTPIGKVSFGPEKLTDNFNALLEAIVKAKPAAAKGQYLRSVTVASTMGPGVKVNPAVILVLGFFSIRFTALPQGKKASDFAPQNLSRFFRSSFSTLSKGKNVSDFAPQNLSRFFRSSFRRCRKERMSAILLRKI